MKKNKTPPTPATSPSLTAEEEEALDTLIAAARSMAESARAARIEAEAVLQTLRQFNENN
jgi:hypothetical protein